MARNISRFLILSLALAPWLSRQDRPIRAAAPNVVSSPIYITHVTVNDTRSGEEDRDRTVIISGNRIQDIETQPGDRTERNGYNYSPEHCLFACGDRSVCHQDQRFTPLTFSTRPSTVARAQAGRRVGAADHGPGRGSEAAQVAPRQNRFSDRVAVS